MTNEQESVLYEYFDQYPDSLTMRQIDLDSDDLVNRIIPLMDKALTDNEPLTDDIFNFDDRADY